MGEQNQIPYLSLKLWAPDSCFWAQTRQSRTPTRILGETILDQFWFPPFPACWSSIHSRVTAKRTRRVHSQKVKEMSLSGWVLVLVHLQLTVYKCDGQNNEQQQPGGERVQLPDSLRGEHQQRQRCQHRQRHQHQQHHVSAISFDWQLHMFCIQEHQQWSWL